MVVPYERGAKVVIWVMIKLIIFLDECDNIR